MKNWVRGEAGKAIIQKAANYVNASMVSLQPGSCIEKRNKMVNAGIVIFLKQVFFQKY